MLTDINETIGLKIDTQELVVDKILTEKNFKNLKSLLQDESSETPKIVTQCLKYIQSLDNDTYAESQNFVGQVLQELITFSSDEALTSEMILYNVYDFLYETELIPNHIELLRSEKNLLRKVLQIRGFDKYPEQFNILLDL